MGWFTSSSSRSSRPGYARSYAGSTYSSRTHHSSTSRYARRPREGYLEYLQRQLRQLWRTVVQYAKRHPYKVFFMVIMPLISGGVLHKLARQFGVELPGGPPQGQGSRGGYGGGGYYGSEGYGMGGVGEKKGGGGGVDLQSIAGGIGGLASLAKMAQTFL
ncbi:hypothetical protein BS50DRAFT_506465 [Corynespora cassiicola Philippines]|uniref:Uncharacterized protein n=1 Tax=Corynespora cassiicola Philippines TaxID=1448308 RepID=A0A2T2N4J7_CORCC|nr:hypothetical protein BS50DRAFT_506465 [Corynespora cassiicola Philippines]